MINGNKVVSSHHTDDLEPGRKHLLFSGCVDGHGSVKSMMMRYPVPLIWDSPVYPSVLHNAFIKAGIPCFAP